jgi:tetratricopeptide (TPR) repeat protein
VRYSPYIELLGRLAENGPEWRPTVAGLAVLRFVDWRLEHDDPRTAADWDAVETIRRALPESADGNPVRAALLSVLERASGANVNRVGVAQSLMQYGRALNLSGRWALAAGVFETVDNIVKPGLNSSLVVQANISRAAALRRLGNWEASADAYARAAHIAHAGADTAGELQVEVGRANTHIARGNLPAAESLLDSVVEKARAQRVVAVLGMALHSRCTVAHQRGMFADAVRLGYDALEASTDASSRDAILSDIAAAFAGMRMYEAARDSYLIVAVTSQSQWVRWQATLNLMELAAIDGQEQAFDDYARELENAALDARLRAYYLLFLGIGQESFGRINEAKISLGNAREFSAQNQLHQIEHDALIAISELKSGRFLPAQHSVNPSAETVTERVLEIAAALGGAREAAVSSP